MGTRARDISISGTGGGGGNITIGSIFPFLTTANVRETSNLYFTNARVFANLELASINTFYDVNITGVTVGDALTWNGNTWVATSIIANVNLLDTDDIREGSNNLYYTNSRVRSAVGAANPTIIYDPITGLFSANVSAISLSANTTDGVPEGFVNKYFTNARVFANIQLASIGDLYDVDFTYTAPTNNKVLVYSDVVNKWIVGDYTTGRAFFADVAEEANTVLRISNFNTDDLTQGANNQYLTPQNLANLLSNTSIDNLKDVNTSNAFLDSVLTWDGNTWIPRSFGSLANATTLPGVETANLALRANFANVAELANFANTANNVNFANSALTANQANNANTASVANQANNANTASVAAQADNANTVSSLANHTTDDLAQGNVNFYYSDDKVYSNVSNMSANTLADIDLSGIQTGNVLVWDGNKFVPGAQIDAAAIANASVFAERSNVANSVLTLTGLTTDDLAEGQSNVYYTANRVRDDIQFALLGKDINLDDLIVSGDLTVNGNTVLLNVANLRTESGLLELASNKSTPSGTEGAGIIIRGANASIRYSELTDSLGVNKDLLIHGNLIPALDSTFSIGSPSKIWRALYVGARTIFLGNTTISESAGGGLQILDQFGNPAGVELANIAATQSVTVDRILGNVIPEQEITSYVGGNVAQFISNTTGNLYLGILKDGLIQKFAGIRVVETRNSAGNVQSDVIIYNDREGVNNSRERIAVRGNGNIEITGNVTVNSNTLVQIARTSLSAQTTVVSNYSNTSVAVTYDQEIGKITVNKDGVYESVAILTLTEDWQDTPVKAAFIPTGTYVVQVIANDSAVGGGHTQEYYSGVMSWYSSDTNSGTADEIALHRAGAGPGNGTIFLRIQRTLTADADDLKLQIAGTTTNSGTSSYNFKFRRLL